MKFLRARKQLSILVMTMYFIPTTAYAEVYLTGKFGTYAFDVDNSGTSSVSGNGAYALDIGYGLGYNLVLSAVFNVLYADMFSGDQGFGFDIAIKHYPISSAGFSKIQTNTLEMQIADEYRPYYGIAFRQREFLLVLTTNYVGPGVFTGLDYQWSNDWYWNFELRYDLLNGPSEATATQMNILFGLGKSF